MATHSSVLAWRIPGTASLVGCRLWGRTESDTTVPATEDPDFLQGALSLLIRILKFSDSFFVNPTHL